MVDGAVLVQFAVLAGRVFLYLGFFVAAGVGVVLAYHWFSYAERPVAGTVALVVYTGVSLIVLLRLATVVAGIV